MILEYINQEKENESVRIDQINEHNLMECAYMMREPICMVHEIRWNMYANEFEMEEILVALRVEPMNIKPDRLFLPQYGYIQLKADCIEPTYDSMEKLIEKKKADFDKWRESVKSLDPTAEWSEDCQCFPLNK